MNEKQKAEATFSKVKKLLEKSGDSLVITFNDGVCGGYINGSTSNVAQSIFCLIHDNNSKVGTDLYNVVKMIVLNMVANETVFSVDLINNILNITKDLNETESKSDDSAMLVGLHSDKHEQGN